MVVLVPVRLLSAPGAMPHEELGGLRDSLCSTHLKKYFPQLRRRPGGEVLDCLSIIATGLGDLLIF